MNFRNDSLGIQNRTCQYIHERDQYFQKGAIKRFISVMAIGVVEFSREGYKIRKDFA